MYWLIRKFSSTASIFCCCFNMILGWPKGLSGFFFLKDGMEKPKQTFWSTQYIHRKLDSRVYHHKIIIRLIKLLIAFTNRNEDMVPYRLTLQTTCELKFPCMVHNLFNQVWNAIIKKNKLVTVFTVTSHGENEIQLSLKKPLYPSTISSTDSKPELFDQSCQNVCERAAPIAHLWKVKIGCIN